MGTNESQKIAYTYHTQWLDVYTRRDVEKLECAKKSKINYLRIYPNATLEENYKINEYKFKNIIDIIPRN